MNFPLRFLLALSSVAFFGCFGSSLQGEEGSGGDGDGAASSGGGGIGGGDGDGDGDDSFGVGSTPFPGTGGIGEPGFGAAGADGGFAGGSGPFPAGPGGVFFPGMPGGPGFPGSPGTPVDLGVCREDFGSVDRNYCERQLQCEDGFAYIWCEDQGGDWWCGCDNPYSSAQFTLMGDIVDACAQVTDLCTGAITPEPIEPEVCSTSYTDSGRNYCSTEVQCNQTLDAGGGLTVDTMQWRNSYCDLGPSGWMCECYDGYYNMRVELPGDLGNPAVCNTVMDACSGDSLTVSGEPECAPRSLYTDRNFCDVQLECAQAAQLDGLDVNVFQYRQAYCDSQGDGRWNCQCGGFGVEQSFELEGADAWDTCTRAGDRCAAL